MVILGAGLAGLSAVYHSGGTVYEKEDDIGGTCRSLRVDGYIFDFGIHVLHANNEYVLRLLSKYRNLNLKSRRRKALIYSYGVLTKYPFQANTFGLPEDIIIECLVGFINVCDKRRKSYRNYQDWIYAAFGKGIADNFYLPYSEKFWTVKARNLTCDWLDVRVPQPSLRQVVRGSLSPQVDEFGPNAIFKYPQYGGIQRIAEALRRRNTKINLCKKAVQIELGKKVVHFSDQTSVRYEKLISTIPLPELFNILDRVPTSIRQAVRGLKHNSVLCVNLGIKGKNISSAHWIYFPQKEYAPFRISFPANFSKSTVPRGWESIQAEISYSRFKPLKCRDIVEKTVQDLIRAKIIKAKDKVKLISTKDIKYAYVIYDHKRRSNLRVINKFLKKHDIYTAGRYGRWEYLWMDEVILSGKNIAEGLKNK